MPAWESVLSGSAKWSVEQGDCIAFLKSLPDDCIDLIVTSPPYTNARLYLEQGRNVGIARKPAAWVTWMTHVCREMSRVCKGLCAVVCEGRTKDFRYCCSPFLLMADLHDAGFHMRKPAVYYRHGIPGKAGDGWSNKWEPIILFSRPGKLPWSEPTATGRPPKFKVGGKMSNRTQDGQRINAAKARKKGGRRGAGDRLRSDEPGKARAYSQPERCNPGNVIRCSVGGGQMGSRKGHANEAPFPESLVEPFVRCFCQPGGIILDPFAGSGTSLAVAVACGRRAVGCDLRPSQVELARQRVSLVTPTMFPEG